MSDTVVIPLAGLRVVQGSGGIEIAYCAKILADAGADVVLLEPADGHPLRRRRVAPADRGGPASALFEYLHTGKRSVFDIDAAAVDGLMNRADVLVADALPTGWDDVHARVSDIDGRDRDAVRSRGSVARSSLLRSDAAGAVRRHGATGRRHTRDR